MRLHSCVEDPPRLVFVLRGVRDTLHFQVPCGVKVGIEEVRILGCREFRHCSGEAKQKARGMRKTTPFRCWKYQSPSYEMRLESNQVLNRDHTGCLCSREEVVK